MVFELSVSFLRNLKYKFHENFKHLIQTINFSLPFLQTIILFLLSCSLQDSDDIYSKSYIPGTLTKYKFETLGTHDAVKESRQNYLSNQKKEQGKHE